MKFVQVSSAILALISGNSYVSATDDSECREKKETCQHRVLVNSTSAVFGLKDDVPSEVWTAFVIASTECLQCVDKSSVRVLHSRDKKCKDGDCKGCGKRSEDKFNCKECCDTCRCMGCEWNYGNDRWSTRHKKCDMCCEGTGRRLNEDTDSFVDFNINVCMDYMNPVDASSEYYTDYERMLEDFQDELRECYADREGFMHSWSSIAADYGINLASMSREEGDTSKVVFGMDEMDTENAKLKSYDSSGSHRSTSHMMFYSALGFVTVAAFAVFGTALVVQVLRKRRTEEEAQAAQWVSELTSVDTANPMGAGAGAETSS